MKTKTIQPIINSDSVTVFPKGRPITVRRDNPNFYALRRACQQKDWDAIERLSSVENAVKAAVAKTFSASESVEVRNGVVFYRGEALDNAVTQKVIAMVSQGEQDVAPWVEFLDKLMQNPDRNSTEQLFNFLRGKDLPIDENGNVLGYKGVGPDFWSKHGNTKTRVLQGKVNESGQILNEVGATIEIERNCVVNNPDEECAEGIHIGSFDYATDWAGYGKVLLVSFNPKDAVSVPHNDFAKLRVCKYKVVADVTEEPEIKKALMSSREAKIPKKVTSISDQSIREAVADMIADGQEGEGIGLNELEEGCYLPINTDATESRVDRQREIVFRIDSYIQARNVDYVPLRRIQSSLSGLVNLTYAEIESICKCLGYRVENKRATD